MTNEDKIFELSLKYFPYVDPTIDSPIKQALLEMAAWKEEQMIDYIYNHAHVTTFGDIRLEKCSVTQFIEDFKKAIIDE